MSYLIINLIRLLNSLQGQENDLNRLSPRKMETKLKVVRFLKSLKRNEKSPNLNFQDNLWPQL